MANAKNVTKNVKNEKKELVNMLTVEAILGFFGNQAKSATKTAKQIGLEVEAPTQKQMKRYAKACRKSLAKVVAECKTVEDFAELSKNLLARLNPEGDDYLNALNY